MARCCFVGLPITVFAVLASVLTNLTGELPWFALLPLPLMALLPALIKHDRPHPFRRGLVTAGLAVVPAAVSVGLVLLHNSATTPA